MNFKDFLQNFTEIKGLNGLYIEEPLLKYLSLKIQEENEIFNVYDAFDSLPSATQEQLRNNIITLREMPVFESPLPLKEKLVRHYISDYLDVFIDGARESRVADFYYKNAEKNCLEFIDELPCDKTKPTTLCYSEPEYVDAICYNNNERYGKLKLRNKYTIHKNAYISILETCRMPEHQLLLSFCRDPQGANNEEKALSIMIQIRFSTSMKFLEYGLMVFPLKLLIMMNGEVFITLYEALGEN